MSTEVRERVSPLQVRGVSVTKLPFGLNAAELVAAFIGVVLIVWVMVYYFSSVRPEQDQLRTLDEQFAEQQKNIMAAARPTAEEPRSDDDAKKDALESLESFKSNHLKPFSSGRIDLIKEINALAKKNNIILTSGIDMGANAGESSAEDKSGEKKPDKKGNSLNKKTEEIFNVYPSVNFRFTVFGPYSNLRMFINELEHEKQFLVINLVNLTNQEAKTSGRRAARGEGGMAGIMLSIEMSAYFKPVA